MKVHSVILSILLTSTIFASDGQLALNTIDDYKIYTLEELMNITIISSTGTEQKLSNAPSIATVITAEQIERSSARTLSEVLAMVPGLNIYTSSLSNQRKSIDIRGIKTDYNSQILTLLNGVNIDSIHDGASASEYFPASAIKRVEVIRGPGSAVYGADAFSGVINIITKDADYLVNHNQAGFRYGSFDSLEVYGNYGEIYNNNVKLGLNLSYSSSNGDSDRIVTSDLQSSLDAAFGTNASLAPSKLDTEYELYNMNLNLEYEEWSLNLWTRFAKDLGLGAGIANVLDDKGYKRDSQILIDLNNIHKFSTDLEWSNKLSYFYLDKSFNFSIFPDNSVVLIGSDGNLFTGNKPVLFTDGVLGNPAYTMNKYQYESSLNIHTFQKHKIRLIAGYSFTDYKARETKNFGPGILDGTQATVDGTLTDVTGSSYIYVSDETRKIFFLSAQDEYSFANGWVLTAGIRYDNYSDFGDTINPRFGLVWNTSDTLTTKLLYGRAFRAPTFTESYAQNNPVGIGNNNLKPETIDMIELGSSYRPNKNLTTALNIYLYKANDLIKNIDIGNGQNQFNNTGKQTGAGVEFETSYQATDKLLFSADYAYRWTQNNATKKAVAEVPIHLAHAMFDYSFSKKLFLNSEVFYTADTPREVGDTRAKIDNYAVVNLSTGYKITDGLETIIAVRNLFDEKYVNSSNANPVNDYPMPGFNMYGELKYRF